MAGFARPMTIIILLLFSFELFSGFFRPEFMIHVVLKNNFENQLKIGSNNIKVEPDMGIIRKDYFDGTDSLNMAIIMTKKNLIIISGLNHLQRLGKEEFLIKRFNLSPDSEEYQARCVGYKLIIAGDTTWCYHYILSKLLDSAYLDNEEYRDKILFGDYLCIPEKGLYFCIVGKNQTIDESVELIRSMVYNEAENFHWKKIDPNKNNIKW